MPNKKISQLNSVEQLFGDEKLLITQSGANKTSTVPVLGTKLNSDVGAAVSGLNSQSIGFSGNARASITGIGSDLAASIGALHRSPNAITSMFVYDTSKDSDGGAWTEKCQHTSWYNESINGKWLGAQESEFYARYAGASVSTNLVTNGDFSNGTTGWNGSGGSVVNGRMNVTGPYAQVTQQLAVTAGKTYEIVYDAFYFNINPLMRVYDSPSGGNMLVNSFGAGLQKRVLFTATTSVALVSCWVSDNGAGQYVQYDNISVREVTATTTQSGDYFQLTTDGKFYRLWKNLLKYSEDFNNALWVKTNLSVVTNNETAPDGTPTADQLIENSVNGYHHIDSNSTSVIPGYYSIRVYLKANGKTLPVVQFKGVANEGYAVYDLTGVTATATNATASITSAGNGWYLCKLTVQATASGTGYVRIFLDNSQYQGNSVSGVYIWGAQLEYGSTATAYEAKGAEGSTSEVFRGNKREFPKLSAIVAEASNVTIYDLTEPGRPMWMRFASTGARTGIIGWTGSGSNVSSLAASNGYLMIGNIASGALVKFVTDSFNPVINSTYQVNGIQNLAQRNNAVTYAGSSGVTNPPTIVVASQNINAVAMTVLPDAPVDPVTSLQVPTIAVATAGGVSVIKHNGAVVSNSYATSFSGLSINKDLLSCFKTNSTEIYRAYNIGSLQAGFDLSADIYYNMPDFRNGTFSTLKQADRNILVRSVSGSATLKKLYNNPSAVAKGVATTITNTFNTGHQVGDIRRTYLSDIDAGSVSGTELVTNGTFDTDISGWTGGGGVWNSNGSMDIVGVAQTTIQTTPGATYKVTLYCSSAGNTAVRAGINGSDFSLLNPSLSAGQKTYYFTATTTTTYFWFQTYAGSSNVDNISIKRVVLDRSYKGQVSGLNGILIKSPVATNAQLVGYSGFSAANYLREPYSADLDFGTGEWTASAWVNTLRADPDANFCTFPEALNNSAMSGITYTAAGIANPVNGDVTANQLLATNGTTGTPTFGWPYTAVPFAVTEPFGITISLYVKSKGSTRLRYYADWVDTNSGTADYDIINGSIISTTNTSLAPTITPVQGQPGWFRVTGRITAIGRFSPKFYFSDASGNFSFTGDGVTGIYAYGLKYNGGYSAGTYTPGKTAAYVPVPGARLFSRSFTSGPNIDLGVNGYGQLVATVTDSAGSPVTRTITSTNTHNNGTWNKVDVTYTTNGTLSLYVNGQAAATAVTGSALASLTNTSAVLTIGNNYSANAPFPGSLALVKLSATVPTDEQRVWMYEQEKAMFQPGAQVCLPSSNAVTDLTYDNLTDTWIAAQSTHISEWKGLVRTSYRKPASGSFDKLSAASGVRLMTRSSWGVDIEAQPVQLKKELFSSTDASINSQNTTTFDFDAVTSQTDFALPVGYTAQAVFSAGVQIFEGSTGNKFTRLFDGFKETIRFATAPGNGVWVKIRAVRAAQ